MIHKKYRGIILILAALAVSAFTGREFLAMRTPLEIRKGAGVAEIRGLGDYFPELKGTRGDSAVYFLNGKNPGATALILGGVHSNEPAGQLAAVLLVENARLDAGRLIVIPQANGSAFTHNDPQEASPQAFFIATPSGKRWFRYGSRSTSPMDQWPDPDIYLHHPSGQTLSGNQTRNLNRAFPGKKNGNFTEQAAFAITELVKREKVSLVIDLHEASPEYPVINTIVAHDRAMPLASAVVMGLELRGVKIGIEPSPKNLRGLTHRELGDHTPALAVLMETANPSQGRLRGKTNEALVVSGKDPLYLKAAGMGRLFVDFDEKGHPLSERVSRHLAGVEEFFRAYSEAFPDQPIVPEKFPNAEEVMAQGIGWFLNP